MVGRGGLVGAGVLGVGFVVGDEVGRVVGVEVGVVGAAVGAPEVEEEESELPEEPEV